MAPTRGGGVEQELPARSRCNIGKLSTFLVANPNPQERKAIVPALPPPKPQVWRMLYIDPEVGNPKPVAALLEDAASRVLRRSCIFDVATNIVEALADVKGDLYEAIFVNESLSSLSNHSKKNEGKDKRSNRPNRSIEGKDLSQFFRQAGMSAPRIIMLVTGDLEFGVGDAAAHGLSALLRKPFTRDGFCDVLRGIFSSDDSSVVAPHLLPTQETGLPSNKPVTSYPCSGSKSYTTSPGLKQQLQHLPNSSDTGKSMLTAASSNPEAIPSWLSEGERNTDVPVLTSASYPECLGFMPIPPSILKSLKLPLGLMKPEQRLQGIVGRKCTKNGPMEDDEAAIPARTPEEPSRDSAVLPAATAGAAVDQAGQGPMSRLAGGRAACEWGLEESLDIESSVRNVPAERDIQTAPAGGIEGEPGPSSTVGAPHGTDEPAASSSRGGLWLKHQEASHVGGLALGLYNKV